MFTFPPTVQQNETKRKYKIKKIFVNKTKLKAQLRGYMILKF